MSAPATRRGLIGAVAGLAATGAALYGCASAPALAADSPDAELLALLAEFEAVNIDINSRWEQGLPSEGSFQGPRFIEDDDERDAVVGPLCKQSQAMLDGICDLYPTTPEGWRAVARSMLVHDSMLRRAVQFTDDPEASMNERLLVILLSGLTDHVVTDHYAIGIPEDYKTTIIPWVAPADDPPVAAWVKDPAAPINCLPGNKPWREMHPVWQGNTPTPAEWAKQAETDLPLLRFCQAFQLKPMAEIEEGFRADPAAMKKLSAELGDLCTRFEKLTNLIRGEAMRYGVAAYRTGVMRL